MDNAFGEFVGGESRFSGSVRQRVKECTLEVFARQVALIHDLRRSGYLFNADELAIEATIKRELQELLAPENYSSIEVLP